MAADQRVPPVRRPQHAAMNDVGGNDEPRHRARVGRGVKSSDRSGSPPRGPLRSPDREARHRPPTRPDHSLHSRHPRSGRPRDHDRRASPEPIPRRHRTDQEDLIPRFREQARTHDVEESSRRRSRSRGRGHGRPSSPPSVKRHRSRSHSPDARHRKRSKRHPSPSRRSREDDRDYSSKHRRRRSPHDYRRSSPRPHASPRRGADDLSRPRGHRGSESPSRAESRRGRRDSRHTDPDDRRRPARSRSLKPSSRQTSRSRPPRDARSPSPGVSSRGRPTSDLDRRLDRPQDPPKSPRAHRDRPRARDSAERHSSNRSDIDDDMGSRGSRRGGYNPMYSHRPQYHNDPRGYSQSPQHAGSYHNSPTQSPYGGVSRPGWGGQFSPSHPYPPSQGPGNHEPPNGPGAHHHSGPPRSPSYGPPPHQGSYRGGPRGGYRGAAAFNGRGGQRGSSFKTSHWGQAEAGRGHPPDEASAGRQTPSREKEPGPPNAGSDDYSSRPRNDDRAEGVSTEDKESGGPRGPSGKAPPSGPSGQGNSSKFSFAFKPSSKPAPAAPKPEISQKFNAAPPRRVSLERSQNDRAPPSSAPTEPASERPRPDTTRNPPDGPRMAPRMRKVTKIMRRPKPRPTLASDLAASESVFFRKPGNESVIGSGTYGKVFKGLNVYTKDLVALKRIRMEGERDGFPVTAVREIKLLQSLRHTNIVNLQEVMVERNDCFMVFEYLSHDLTGLLNHPTFQLEPAQKKHLAKQMYDGLEYLHNRGVLHRDIKAANILVSNEGILKLADFGLARFYAKHHKQDYTNRVITIWYRSPELLLGETQYSAAVDIWSAACVMIEIFTRQAIFPGDGTEQCQLDKIYNILGTPNLKEWPEVVQMPWFELLKPKVKMKNVFADKYKDRVTPAALELLTEMFRFDPSKRPTAAEVLQHAYFTTEEPLPKQAVELSSIDGDWHEFESKALRKENERRDREAARKAAREKDKKRPIDGGDQARDAKRQAVEGKKPAAAIGDAA